MLINLISTIYLFNIINLGISFGPHLPMGRLDVYRIGTSVSLLSEINRFELNYTYSQFSNQFIPQEKLNMHGVTIAYEYPISKNEYRKISIQVGTGYYHIIRHLKRNHEQGTLWGLRYGVKYEQILVNNNFQPTLFTLLHTDQIVQSRRWQNQQLNVNNYLVKILIGIKIKIL